MKLRESGLQYWSMNFSQNICLEAKTKNQITPKKLPSDYSSALAFKQTWAPGLVLVLFRTASYSVYLKSLERRLYNIMVQLNSVNQNEG